MSVSALLTAAVPLAWLLPNHYAPWSSAWLDGLALVLLFAATLTQRQAATLPPACAAFAGLIAASVLLQAITGRMLFGGDVLMVLFYVAAFVCAVVLGTTLPGAPSSAGTTALDALALVTVAAAVASVGIALVQWTGAVLLGIWGVELRPGARASANLAQPNHFSSALFLGLCASGFLRQRGHLGRAGWWLLAGWLLLGLVLSGSRTAWLQLGWLIGLTSLLRRRVPVAVPTSDLLLLALVSAGVALAWPAVNEFLAMEPGRSHAEQMQGGTRLPNWRVLFDAALLAPWQGHGWVQVSIAQQAAALDHPFIGEHLEHSHNLVLDFVLWAGIPVGLALAGIMAWWFLGLLRHCRDPRALWLLLAAGGLFVHAMLEYPLEFAYFLIPLGLYLGAAHAMSPAAAQWRVPVVPLRFAGAALGALLVAVSIEYLKAEQNHRLLRLESARIGTSRIVSQAPDLHLLTQLGAFLRFARTVARPDMSADEVAWMRQISGRFAYPPVLLRYALAAGLNGRPEESRRMLDLLCRSHPRPTCADARESWLSAQARYPALAAVAAPVPP